MTKDEYQEYLKSDHWKKISRQAIGIKKRCQQCAFPYELNVHHQNYERLGRELITDLIVLCRACHARHHMGDDDEDVFKALYSTDKKVWIKKRQEEIEAARKKNLDREIELQKNRERDQDL